MPVKRRRPKSAHLITPGACEAFEAGDWRALNKALGFPRWEPSPLLKCMGEEHIGCCPLDKIFPHPKLWAEKKRRAVEIRQELLALVGELEPGVPSSCRCARADIEYLRAERNS